MAHQDFQSSSSFGVPLAWGCEDELAPKTAILAK